MKMTVIPLAVLVCIAAITPAQAQRTMGLMMHDTARSYQGYTFFAPLPYNVTYLIDNEGRLVQSWEAERVPAHAAYFQEDGLLLRTANMENPIFTPGGSGGRVEHIDWDGSVVWQFDYSDSWVCLHHDIEPMPNGNVLMIAWESKLRDEVLENGRDTAYIDSMLWPDHVIEVHPDNDSIVWEWHIWDHLIQDFDSTKLNYGVVSEHPELVDFNVVPRRDPRQPDWNHTNAIHYNPELDQIVLSPRPFHEFWVIDHSTTTEEAAGHTGGRYGKGGDLLYRWGNPQNYGRGGPPQRRLIGQHDPAWIADSLPGAGNILIFNNGNPNQRPWSTVDEIAPPMDSAGFYHLGQDSAYGPAWPLWQFIDTTWFFSQNISGCQRLPNGNTLICSGADGTLFEVTPDSEVVWLYINPVTDTGPMIQGESIPPGANPVFKAYRYSPDFAGFVGRNLEPGNPIERYPGGITAPKVRTSRATLSCPGVVRSGTPVFAAVSGGHTRLAVYDCMGREVAKLVDEVLPAGRHDLHWSTRNLASGSYFLKLTLGTATSTRPVVVTRW
ncbi:MAG: aryl-sulfate sulfotransferase [candidate division WOR-3 bacterium]|nr:MAG: aryl-sulfate sulfotransferase [candidate division WOR-3 bacterium]